MKQKKNKLILIKDEFELLKGYIRSILNTKSTEAKNAEQLAKEFANMPELVDKEAFPADAVRINSQVTVQEKTTGKRFNFKIVLPSQANLSAGRISVFAPIGTAAIGYRKGASITWQMPAGTKEFTIVEVVN